jgi:hypothetical protein
MVINSLTNVDLEAEISGINARIDILKVPVTSRKGALMGIAVSPELYT